MLYDSIVLVSYVWSERAHSYLKLNQNWKSQSQPLANPLGIIHSWRSAVKMINTHVLCPWSHYHSLSALSIGCCASSSANRGQLGAVTKRSGWQMQHTRNLQPTSLWESSCRRSIVLHPFTPRGAERMDHRAQVSTAQTTGSRVRGLSAGDWGCSSSFFGLKQKRTTVLK